MKKIALIIAFLMILPGVAFSLETLNDTTMDSVTGQSGVSIAFDDVQLFLQIDQLAWIDDGFAANTGYGSGTGSAGAVGITNFQLDVLRVNMITGTATGTVVGNDLASTGQQWAGGNGHGLYFTYGATGTTLGGAQLNTTYTTAVQTLGLDNWSKPANVPFHALTIDATSQLPAATEGFRNNADLLIAEIGTTPGSGTFTSAGSILAGTVNIGGVLIGIPTMEINIPDLEFTPAFFNVDGGATAGTDIVAINDYYSDFLGHKASYGTVAMEDVTVTTLGGWLEIAPH